MSGRLEMTGRQSHVIAWLSAGCAGLVFGFGLLLAGMANPDKVLRFLDVTGQWDPSLALVMAGAIGISMLAYAIAGFRGRSLLELPIEKPARLGMDKRLVLGSATFGIGWGLAGICPGPAFVLLGAGSVKGIVFLAFMLLGFALFEWHDRRA